MAKKRIDRLRATISKIQAALDEAYADPDRDMVASKIQEASLLASYWRFKSQVAAEQASTADEIDFDKRHQEAMTQYARLKSKEKDDLLPKILARAGRTRRR